MEVLAWVAVAIFAATIIAVITNVVDSTVAALIGANNPGQTRIGETGTDHDCSR